MYFCIYLLTVYGPVLLLIYINGYIFKLVILVAPFATVILRSKRVDKVVKLPCIHFKNNVPASIQYGVSYLVITSINRVYKFWSIKTVLTNFPFTVFANINPYK